MKFAIIFLLVPLMTSAEVFKIAGQEIVFKTQDGLVLNGCEKGCEALKVIQKHKKIDLTSLRKGQKYINSTGSDVCALQYKAKSVIGIMENRDQRAFCVFTDASMVEMNSLGAYLETKNFIKK